MDREGKGLLISRTGAGIGILHHSSLVLLCIFYPVLFYPIAFYVIILHAILFSSCMCMFVFLTLDLIRRKVSDREGVLYAASRHERTGPLVRPHAGRPTVVHHKPLRHA